MYYKILDGDSNSHQLLLFELSYLILYVGANFFKVLDKDRDVIIIAEEWLIGLSIILKGSLPDNKVWVPI